MGRQRRRNKKASPPRDTALYREFASRIGHALPRPRVKSEFLAARAAMTAAAAVVGGVSLGNLKEAIKRAIDIDSTLMRSTGDPYVESTLSAHIGTLAQELSVLEAIIAANLFPSPEVVEDTLGRDFVAVLTGSIGQLETLIVSDANFSAFLTIGVRLSAAVERLRGGA